MNSKLQENFGLKSGGMELQQIFVNILNLSTLINVADGTKAMLLLSPVRIIMGSNQSIQP